MNNQELYHYGVPGMRWGVRKVTSGGTVNSGARKKLNDHNKMVNKLKTSGELPKKYPTDGERYTVIKGPGAKKTSQEGSSKKPPKGDVIKRPSKDDKTKKPSNDDKTTKNDQVNEPAKKTSLDEKAKLQKSIDNLNTSKTVLDNSSRAFNEASNMAARAARNARSKPSEKVKKELSEMDDNELRNRINRIRMEREYSDLNPSSQAMAAERTSYVLSTIGSLVAIGGSIAGIAVAMKQLKAKN